MAVLTSCTAESSLRFQLILIAIFLAVLKILLVYKDRIIHRASEKLISCHYSFYIFINPLLDVQEEDCECSILQETILKIIDSTLSIRKVLARKWQIQSQNTDTPEEKNNIQHVQEDIEKINRNESIAQKVEEISTLNILKDKLDCNINISSNTPFGNIENNAIPEIQQSMVQQSVVSQDSGFATSRTESSIYTDSAPPGSMSTECLLISGSTPYPYRSSQSHGNSYLPGSFLTTNSRAVSDGTASIQSSFASADIQSAIARPEHLNYKHPEMETVTDRIDTFLTWPHKDIQDPRIVATAGFYYTMDHDIVRCFCCDLGLSEWDENDSPWTEHARHSLIAVSFSFQIYNPKFPNLIDEGDRIKTFSNWPNIVVRPTSIDIAKAGFFYTGRGDECRCHYCDGGLQHWESGDNPWEQHAYYFPFCKFVIKMKGRDFISQIRERFVASSPNVDALMRESEEAEGKQEFKDIVNFGYSKKSIKLAAEEVFKDTGDFKFTPQHVLNKILDIQDRDDSLPVDDDDEDETEETEEAKHKSLLTADEFMKELEKEQPVEDNAFKGFEKTLSFLEVIWTNFHNIPISINKLTNLNYVNFKDNHFITEIPEDAFTGLHNITTMNFEGNGIKTMPAIFKDSDKMYQVTIKSDELTNITDSRHSAKSQSKFYYLTMTNTKFVTVPITISNMPTVTVISLVNGSIETIQSNDFQQLPALANIVLSFNPIESVNTNAFMNLPSLRYLSLDGTQLTTVPEAIANTNVSWVNMNNTKIECTCSGLNWMKLWPRRLQTTIEGICINTGTSIMNFVTSIIPTCKFEDIQ
ncbi:BIRC2_3 [Mytilus edulis]|uniref:BIRC2_3 n=1 Tax=Mytilus edulis TaxID=6550 RepID=A0A8S3PM14_MYTED|nr:BIRC2_3 [Mytilus edulis]